MGRWGGEQQLEMFVPTCELRSGSTHVFYERLNELLRGGGFDAWLEALCEDYYAEGGRPSIPPGVYFRMLFVGCFEDITSRCGTPGGVRTVCRCGPFCGARRTGF